MRHTLLCWQGPIQSNDPSTHKPNKYLTSTEWKITKILLSGHECSCVQQQQLPNNG